MPDHPTKESHIDSKIFLPQTTPSPKQALIGRIEMILDTQMSDATKIRFIKEEIRKS